MKLVALCSRANRTHLLLQFRRPVHRHAGAAVIGHRRIGPIGGQLQPLGQPGQRVLPVGQLRGDAAVAVVQFTELRALPQRVIDILHRQRRPRRGLPRTPAGIGHPQITSPAGRSTSRRRRYGAPPQPAHARPRRGGKALPAKGSRSPGQTRGAPPRRWPHPAGPPASRRRQRRSQPNIGPLRRHHQLLRYPVGRGEQRAQAFMAADHVGQRRTQRVEHRGARRSRNAIAML